MLLICLQLTNGEPRALGQHGKLFLPGTHKIKLGKANATGAPLPRHARISRLWAFLPRCLSDSGTSSCVQFPKPAPRADDFPGTYRERDGCVSCASPPATRGETRRRP